ncbi:MAG: BlaI/MecI/CopY family transcriptional regulator [Fimbriimonas sp.]
MSPIPPSKRERQILDILYRLGEASVADIHAEITDASYSAVRGILRIMHEKGLVTSRADGVRHVFAPAFPKEEAAKSALETLVTTFFGGSVESVVSTLLTEKERDLSDQEYDRLVALIENARRAQND